jgi:Zn-dependent protease with chaperone function
LLRVWRIEDGAWRLRFRLLALAGPALGLPVLFLVAPFRSSPTFAARWALFAGERWDQIHVAGLSVGDISLLLSAGAGSALFLRDALPPLVDALRGASHVTAAGPWHVTTAALRTLVRDRAARLGIRTPQVRVVDAPMPVLLCEGAVDPVLVVSPATLERLGPDEVDAAITHELAHAKHRDPAWSYLLVAARALLFFNPAAQWIARAMVDDIERRADQAAVAVTGNAEALARTIVRLFDVGHPPPLDGDASFERVFWRVRREGVERRCERLRRTPEAVATNGSAPLLALAALGLLGLVFFVV